MHMLSWLAEDGVAAIVEYPGVLYRGGAEAKIRKYLIDNNFVEAVIQLPPDLFFGTGIATCIIVLKKAKTDNKVLFIDATKLVQREGNKNKLRKTHQDTILRAYTDRVDVPYLAALVDKSEIAASPTYNISVTSYVKAEDTREAVDIVEVNARLVEIVARQTKLRTKIDSIVADLEAGA